MGLVCLTVPQAMDAHPIPVAQRCPIPTGSCVRWGPAGLSINGTCVSSQLSYVSTAMWGVRGGFAHALHITAAPCAQGAAPQPSPDTSNTIPVPIQGTWEAYGEALQHLCNALCSNCCSRHGNLCDSLEFGHPTSPPGTNGGCGALLGGEHWVSASSQPGASLLCLLRDK